MIKKKAYPILSKNYILWIEDLKKRYLSLKVKVALSLNSSLIEFYWNVGKDIFEQYSGQTSNSAFFKKISSDLNEALPNAKGFSPSNFKYAFYFFKLYSRLTNSNPSSDCLPNSDWFLEKLYLVPWGHHVQIINKCHNDPKKALFYVQRTIQNGWTRSLLLNHISSNLYEREKQAQTNFNLTLPKAEQDLAGQIMKDPQIFEVLGLGRQFKESELKSALTANIEKTLVSLGRGIAFVGREYPLEAGGEEKIIDLLFYVIPLHRYLVVEVKTCKYEFEHLGQLSGYIALVKHVLNTPQDNQPIGLLVCKEHNRILAQYHLDEINSPLGISNYELKSALPSEEIIEAEIKKTIILAQTK